MVVTKKAATKVANILSESESDDDPDEVEISDSDSASYDSSSSEDDGESTTSSEEDEDVDDTKSIRSCKSTATLRSKRHTSKNVMKIYLANRKRFIDTADTDDLVDLGINLNKFSDLKDKYIADFYGKMVDDSHNEESDVEDEETKNIWEHENFKNVSENFKYDSEILVNPPEISEGAIECPKCGSALTFNYQKNTRSADEGSTTFIKCLAKNCGLISRSYA